MLATRLTRLDLEAGATELRTCICGVQGEEPWGESPQTFDSQEKTKLSKVSHMPVHRLLEAPVRVPLAIAQVLAEAGIEFVFGMPGGRTGAIFDGLYDYRDRIRTVLVREEGLAAVMARAMGCLGVRVTEPSQLAPTLSEALAANRPAVVDVVTSGRLTFRDVTADLSTLAAQAVI